jgi:DNA-binding MarR family transcriptional regulator
MPTHHLSRHDRQHRYKPTSGGRFRGPLLTGVQRPAQLPQSTMSRHLLDLGIMRRDRSPGLGLIDQRQDKDDLRKNIYCLSDRGRKLVHDLEAALSQKGRVR